MREVLLCGQNNRKASDIGKTCWGYIGFGANVEQFDKVLRGDRERRNLFYPTYDFPAIVMTIETFLTILLAGLSFLLFVVSMFSYRRVRNIKILIVSIAFLLFFIKALVLIGSLATNTWEDWGMRWELLLFDVIIIVMLYLSIARK